MVSLVDVWRVFWRILQVGAALRWVHVSSGLVESPQEGPIICSRHAVFTLASSYARFWSGVRWTASETEVVMMLATEDVINTSSC